LFQVNTNSAYSVLDSRGTCQRANLTFA